MCDLWVHSMGQGIDTQRIAGLVMRAKLGLPADPRLPSSPPHETIFPDLLWFGPLTPQSNGGNRRLSVAGYGIHTFDWAADCAARAKPAAMAANCAHPARIVLGPGGL